MNPKVENLLKMSYGGHDMTSAEAYALTAVMAVRKAAKLQERERPGSPIYLPKPKGTLM